MTVPTPDLDSPAPGAAEDPPPKSRPARASVDDMSEASFPASDAPAVWTWDPRPPAAG